MAGERAPLGIAVAAGHVVGIDRLQPSLLAGGRREAHRPGDVDHQIKINVGRERVARRRCPGNRNVPVADHAQEERWDLCGKRQSRADHHTGLGHVGGRIRSRVAGRPGQIRVEEVDRGGRAPGNVAVAGHRLGGRHQRRVGGDRRERCRIGCPLQLGADHRCGRIVDHTADGGDERKRGNGADDRDVCARVRAEGGEQRAHPREPRRKAKCAVSCFSCHRAVSLLSPIASK